MQQIVFEILQYIGEALILTYYAKSFFDMKYKVPTVLATSLAGYMVLLLVYKFAPTQLNVIALIVVNALLLAFLYKCNWRSAIFHAVILIFTMAVTEWIVISLISFFIKEDFNAYETSFSIFSIDVILNKLAYLCMCILIVKFFGGNKKANEGQKRNSHLFWALMVMPFASIVVVLTFYGIVVKSEISDALTLLCTWASALLLFSNIIVFFIYEKAMQNSEELYELQTIEQKEEIDKTYLNILQKNNDNLKIFIHDIKNHLLHIAAMADDEEVNAYVFDLCGEVGNFAYTGMSKNKTLDIIISKYLSLCQDKGITITFDVKTANLKDINSTDLSTILNNLMDNAVESAEKSQKKKIHINVFLKNKLYEVVQIQNSCDVAPKPSKGGFLTSKRERDNHGFGTKSIKKTVEKYDGVLDWEYDDATHIFTTTLVFQEAGAIK